MSGIPLREREVAELTPGAMLPAILAGIFTTENHISYYEVWLENASAAESGGERLLSPLALHRALQQGKQDQGGAMAAAGPAGRDIDWSWRDFE